MGRYCAGKAGETSLEKGEYSEELVREALEQLRGEEKIERFKRLDSPGFDFVIWVRGGKIFLEVKSSEGGLREHKGRYPHIPVVAVFKNPPLDRRGPRSGKLSRKEKKRTIKEIKKYILSIIEEQRGALL